jgi:hypothetical protein
LIKHLFRSNKTPLFAKKITNRILSAKRFGKTRQTNFFCKTRQCKSFGKTLKNKEFAVVNSNNFHQLCWH